MTKIGRIEDIFTAPSKGMPMRSHYVARAIKDVGLQGDRYANGTGAWSNVRLEVPRHITLIEIEVVRSVASRGLPLTAELTRRNIVTSGVRLNEMIGKRLKLGALGPIIRGVELCEPCEIPGSLSKNPILKEGLKAALAGRGGLRAEVLTTEIVTVFNPIYLLE